MHAWMIALLVNILGVVLQVALVSAIPSVTPFS